MDTLVIVDWIAILTVPVALLIWCVGNVIITNQSIKRLNEIYKSD